MNAESRSARHALVILALAVFAADQASKYAVERFTAAGSLRVLIPGFLNLVHTRSEERRVG